MKMIKGRHVCPAKIGRLEYITGVLFPGLPSGNRTSNEKRKLMQQAHLRASKLQYIISFFLGLDLFPVTSLCYWQKLQTYITS